MALIKDKQPTATPAPTAPTLAPGQRSHDVSIIDLLNHPFFTLQVKCSCGATLYAKDPSQAEAHKQFHLGQVKRQGVINDAAKQ